MQAIAATTLSSSTCVENKYCICMQRRLEDMHEDMHEFEPPLKQCEILVCICRLLLGRALKGARWHAASPPCFSPSTLLLWHSRLLLPHICRHTKECKANTAWLLTGQRGRLQFLPHETAGDGHYQPATRQVASDAACLFCKQGG